MSLKRNTGKASKAVAENAQKALLIERILSHAGGQLYSGMRLDDYTIAELKNYVKSLDNEREEIELRRRLRELGYLSLPSDSLSDLRKILKNINENMAAESARVKAYRLKQFEASQDTDPFAFMFPRPRRALSLPRRASLKFRCK